MRAENTTNSKADTIHSGCVVCGYRNRFGLVFTPDESGRVRAELETDISMQGYDGIVRGGIISSFLDSAMANCLFYRKIQGFTAELKVRFLHPVPCNCRIFLTAECVSSFSHLHKMKASLFQGERLMARATAKFMECPLG